LLIDMFVLVYLNILINVYFGFVAYLQNKHMRKAVNNSRIITLCNEGP